MPRSKTRSSVTSATATRKILSEGISPESLLRELGARISPTASKEPLSRAWQWKSALERGTKTKLDLYEELGKAPAGLAYFPTPTGLIAHEAKVKTKQFAGGWRYGKSTWLAAEALPFMFRDNASIWIVANDYKLGHPEFEYIRDWLLWFNVPLVTDSTPNVGPWRLVTAWGAELVTQTGADITKIEAGNLDAAVVAEAGLVDPDIIRRLRGRVGEKRGPILMSGSLDMSEPWYMESFEQFFHGPTETASWQSFGAPSWENLIVFPDGREDQQIKEWEAELNEDEFKLKVACEVAKPSELVFPEFDVRTHVKEMNLVVRNDRGELVEYPEPVTDQWGFDVGRWNLPKRDPVHLAIDPGSRGAYAVLAIRLYDDQVFVIDEIYMRLAMVEDVIDECKMREWWRDVNFAVMDIAGKQRPAMASHADIWAMDHNLGFYPAMTYTHIEDGIEHLKTFLKNPLNKKPRLWIHPQCKATIKEFGLYRYRTVKENRPISEEPVDNNNHSIKALTYYLVNRFKPGGRGMRTTSDKYIGRRNNTHPFVEPLSERGGPTHYKSFSDWAMTDDENNLNFGVQSSEYGI